MPNTNSNKGTSRKRTRTPTSTTTSSSTKINSKQNKSSSTTYTSAAQILEYTSYLEYYLWPHFNGSVSFEHIMSIILVSTKNLKICQ